MWHAILSPEYKWLKPFWWGLRVVFWVKETKKRESFAKVGEQETCVYGCTCGREANCRVLEGFHQILLLPYCRRQGEITLVKVQTNKKHSNCCEQRAGSITTPVSFYCPYCKSRVTRWEPVRKVSDVYPGVRYSGSGGSFGATAVGSSPAQTVSSWSKISDALSAYLNLPSQGLLL